MIRETYIDFTKGDTDTRSRVIPLCRDVYFTFFLRTFEKNNGEITDSLSCINSIDLRHRESINSQ